MPFQNTIMPDVTPSEMRGMWSLLDMIGSPKAKVAADFLKHISEEKDAAVEFKTSAMVLGKQAAADKLEAERLHNQTKAHRDEMENRLAKTDADLRVKIEAHAKAAAALQAREDDFRVKQTAHASAVAAHKKEVEAAKASHEVREAALKEREENIAQAHVDLEDRKSKFNERMAPVLAAASLAGGF